VEKLVGTPEEAMLVELLGDGMATLAGVFLTFTGIGEESKGPMR